jgi:DNA-directed RNA polymerase subunit RPC12/RpoP
MAKITGNMVKCDECGAELADPDNQADYEKYERIICLNCGLKIICFNCLELKAVA